MRGMWTHTVHIVVVDTYDRVYSSGPRGVLDHVSPPPVRQSTQVLSNVSGTFSGFFSKKSGNTFKKNRKHIPDSFRVGVTLVRVKTIPSCGTTLYGPSSPTRIPYMDPDRKLCPGV